MQATLTQRRGKQDLFDQALSSNSNTPEELVRKFIDGDSAAERDTPLGSLAQIDSLVHGRTRDLSDGTLLELHDKLEERVTDLLTAKGGNLPKSGKRMQELARFISSILEVREQDARELGEASLCRTFPKLRF